MSSRRASSRHMVRRSPSVTSTTRHAPTRPPPSASSTYQYDTDGSFTTGNQYDAATASFEPQAPYQSLASPYVSSSAYQGVDAPMRR
jgi:hypothetical protein